MQTLSAGSEWPHVLTLFVGIRDIPVIKAEGITKFHCPFFRMDHKNKDTNYKGVGHKIIF